MSLDNIIGKYNKGNKFTFVTPKEFEYISLKELFKLEGKKQHQLNVLYINTKSRYGDAGVAVTDSHLVNLPKHLTDTVKEMMNDSEFVEATNNQLIGFTIYEYEGTNGLGYSVNWESLNAF